MIRLAWRAFGQGFIKLNTDGSCRSHGQAGSGGVLRNSQGCWVSEFAVNLGKKACSVAAEAGVYFMF